MPIAGEHFVGGVVRSVTDFERFTRGLNPWDPYNITHPAQYLTHLNSTAAGLVDMAAHPERLPGTILGTGWGSDGSEASGRLLGNILFAIATDGGSAAGKTAAEGAAKNAAKDAAERAGTTAADGGVNLFRRAARRPRNGPPMRMTDESVRDIAARYSIDLRGIRVRINKSVSGLEGSTPSATQINLYRGAFFDEEQLARTLAHERFHVDQIKRGVPIPTDEAGIDIWETEAYAHEDQWWDNHPNNQPGDSE